MRKHLISALPPGAALTVRQSMGQKESPPANSHDSSLIVERIFVGVLVVGPAFFSWFLSVASRHLYAGLIINVRVSVDVALVLDPSGLVVLPAVGMIPLKASAGAAQKLWQPLAQSFHGERAGDKEDCRGNVQPSRKTYPFIRVRCAASARRGVQP